MNPSPHAVLLVLCLALAARPGLAVAQSTRLPAPLSFDWGPGLLLSIPGEFESEPCGSLYGAGATVAAAVALTTTVAVESSLAVVVPRPTTCAADRLPPPADGTVTRLVLRDGIDRSVFASSAHRLIFDPATTTSFRPRILLGVGRLWTHRAWFLSTGVGIRFGPDRWPRVVEIERIYLRLPYVEETDRFSGGVLVDRSVSPEMRLAESMWSVRFRLPLRR